VVKRHHGFYPITNQKRVFAPIMKSLVRRIHDRLQWSSAKPLMKTERMSSTSCPTGHWTGTTTCTTLVLNDSSQFPPPWQVATRQFAPEWSVVEGRLKAPDDDSKTIREECSLGLMSCRRRQSLGRRDIRVETEMYWAPRANCRKRETIINWFQDEASHELRPIDPNHNLFTVYTLVKATQHYRSTC
jgi:hypothetical protein